MFKIGDRVKIIGSTFGDGCLCGITAKWIGKTGKVIRIGERDTVDVVCDTKGIGENYFYLRDLVKIKQTRGTWRVGDRARCVATRLYDSMTVAQDEVVKVIATKKGAILGIKESWFGADMLVKPEEQKYFVRLGRKVK